MSDTVARLDGPLEPGIDLRDVDTAAWRRLMTVPYLALATVLSWAIAVLAAHPIGVASFHLENRVPSYIVGAWPLTYAAAMLAGDEIFSARLRPLFAVLLWHGVAVWTTLGACSERSLGVGWLPLLLLPPCWGQIFPNNRTLLAAMVVVPPVQRAIVVRGATPGSLVLAAAIGVAISATYWAFSERRLRAHASERKALARALLGTTTPGSAGSMRVAMRLHDGLSGASMLACARAARGTPDDALAAGHALVTHARGILEALAGSTVVTAPELPRALEAFASHAGVTLHAEFGELEGVDGGLLGDLHDILIELIANEARHGDGSEIHLSVRVRRGHIRASMTTAGHAPRDGSGRGLRNILLRAQALGGDTWVEQDASSSRFEVLLRVPAERSRLWPEFLLDIVFYLALPATLLAAGSSLVVVAALGAGGAVLAAVHILTTLARARRDDAGVDVRRRIHAATVPAAARAARELGRAVDDVERAVGTGRDEAARHAIDAFAELLADLLQTLEASAEPLDVSPEVRA